MISHFATTRRIDPFEPDGRDTPTVAEIQRMEARARRAGDWRADVYRLAKRVRIMRAQKQAREGER